MRRGPGFSHKKRRTLAAGSPSRLAGRQTPVMARVWGTTGDAGARLDDDGDGRRLRHVRWIALSPHDADLLLVGIELGGLMRSTDGGETWDDHRPGAQPDVHSLAWHPHVQGRAYEAGGGGSAWSDDGGDTWQRADDGRDRNYTWSVAVDPLDPDCWYVSASTGPFAAHGGREPQARVYRRRGDEPWQALNGGLPEPLPAMPYALVASEQRLFAGLANGTLWQSDDRGDTWRACALDGDALPAINALALTAES